jgi:membrane fusion protein, copper/silver efflux system
MKTILLFLLSFTVPLIGAPDRGAAAAENRLYRCPMHPAVTSNQPGKCTICGMALVAATATDASAATGMIALSPSAITTVGVETATAVTQPLTRTLHVTGRIDDDDTRHRILSARVPGRVEKLHLNFVGAPVEAGAPLATIYSPEILTAQRIYLERLKAGEDAFPAAERSAARERLFELGLTDNDLASLEKTREASATVVIRAPGAGTVVSKSVYEGQYVQAADRMFEIADFSRMWFVFDVYEQDLAWIRIGQAVEITTRAVPGEIITAAVEFIDPNFDETTRATKARAILPNPHYNIGGQPHSLPHRVLAEGRVQLDAPPVLTVPRSAVLDSGKGPVAYVDAGDRHFAQRKLKLGRRGDDFVEVLEGIAEGEKVVTRGALLIDAQAQLMSESNQPVSTPSAKMPSSQATPASAESALPQLANAAIAAAAALAADDYPAYQKSFPTLAAAARNFPALPKIEVGTDLKTARRSFEPWSTAVADFLKPHREHLGLKVFQCPMSPVLGKGRWVQRGEPLRNPFFGATMLECGEEIP